jgi:phosphomethylpyrimidine synthase
MRKQNACIGELNNSVVKLKSKNGFIEAGPEKKTLINCLIGINDESECSYELEKLDKIINAVEKPDIITDLSTKRVRAIDTIWYKIANDTQYVAGSLPIYLTKFNNGHIDENELLDIIIEQMENGVGLITIHPTANKTIFDKARKRMLPITSRGGGIVIKDLIAKEFMEDNVYLKILPQIILHARRNNVALSIGATFRSGNIFDCNDEAQMMEIESQITLAKLISQHGVGVIIESPGHARPKDIIEISSVLKKAGFPVMPLGPIPTDIAVGMDHISSAIGAAIMGLNGCTNIIAVVTREEHTGGRPTVESIIEAIKIAKISAHIIDIHNIEDTDLDMIIAEDRAKTNTCIYGKLTKYCDRCKELCPLSIR